MEGPHPHQIVGYSALAPEERAALEAARALVDEQIERDARSLSVDLMDLLRHPAVEPYLLAAVHDAQSDDPLRRAQFAPASPRPFVKMPAVLEQAIAGVQYEMFAGLFADLNHAWLTVDHRFFMWNFEDPLGAFVQFDGLDQSIVSAALIRPPAGAFAEEVPYAVLLATPLEVTVLGVRLLGGGAGSGPRVELFHTGVRVLTDNVNMVKMVGTPSGRIFMAGADGFLYELTLRNTTSGWWAAPAAKRPCSRRLERVRHFVWSALFDANDPIIELMVDNERQVLVTLSRTGTLQLYSLGEAGDRLTWLCAKTADALRAELTHAPSKCVRRGAVDLLAKDIEAATNAPPTAPAAPLVAVSAIPEAISREVQLVVTSALGVRIFLSYGHTAASQQLHALCAHAALDPPPSGLGDAPRRADADAGGGFGGLAGGSAFGRAFDPQPAFGGAQGQEQMAVPLDGALYAAGCSLLVDARALPHAELVCLAPIPTPAQYGGYGGGAYGSAAGYGGAYGGAPVVGGTSSSVSFDELSESVTRLRLSAAVYAIAEVPSVASTSPFAPAANTAAALAYAKAVSKAAGGNGNGNGAGAVLNGSGLTQGGGSASTVVGLADARGALGELVSQVLAQPRRFAVLTAAGVHLVEKRRPLEALAVALGQAATEHLERESALRHVFARFGPAEACAMALAVGALAPPSARAAAPAGALSGLAICAWARQLGGEARRDHGNAAAAGATSFGQAIEPDSVRFSGRHGGLAAVAARLLACAWALPIVTSDQTGLRVARSRKQWATLAGALRQLCAFLRANTQAWGLLAPRAGDANDSLTRRALSPGSVRECAERTSVEAAERASSSALLRLLERAAQAAALVCLLAEPDSSSSAAPSWSADSPSLLPFAFLQRLAARLPDAEQQALSRLTFADVVCPSGRAVPGSGVAVAGLDGARTDRLARALLLELLRDHRGDSALVARLQRDCAAFFSAAEYALYSVWSDLFHASTSDAPPAERARALRSSLRTCAEHALSVELRTAVGLFAAHGLYEAVIDLPLARASKADPMDAARVAVAGNHVAGGFEARALAERLAAYRVAADALQALHAASLSPAGPGDNVREAPPPTDMWRRVLEYGLQRRPVDEIFHKAIFWWLLAAGHAALLPKLDSPVLESWLGSAADGGAEAVARTWGVMLRGPDGPADVAALCEKVRNLEPLAAFYVQHERHVEAARAFAALAEREPEGGNPGPTIEQREAWLVQAVIAARAAGDAGAALGPDFVRTAEQRLQVARAQSKVLAGVLSKTRMDGSAEAQCKQLRSRLFDIETLYALCERFELALPALAVLAVAAPYQQYSERVETHLDELLQNALAGGWASACETVRELRAHFCAPAGAEAYVFRLDQICHALEQDRLVSGSPGDAIELLAVGVQPQVPWESLWHTYADAHTRGRRMQAIWEESATARLHLLGAIHALVQGWVRCQADSRSFAASRQRVTSGVDSFVVELNTMTDPTAPELRDAFKALRKELTLG